MQQLSDQVKFNNRRPHRGKKTTQGVIGKNKVRCWVQIPRTAPEFLRVPYITRSGQSKNRLVLNSDSHPIHLEDGTVKKVVHIIIN